MAKPDPALLDPARYPFHCTLETRYCDLDSNLHINNGVMASLLEEARDDGRVRGGHASTAKAWAAAAGFFALGTPEAEGRLLALSAYPDPSVKQLIQTLRRRALAEAKRSEPPRAEGARDA